MKGYLGTISDVSFQVGGASMVVVVARSIDSEGILFLTRILRSSPLFCSRNAPCGRKAGHRTGMGEALGHLCTQGIEMGRATGYRDVHNVPRPSLRMGGFHQVASLREPSSRCLTQAAQPHAPHLWVSPVTFIEPGRGASTDIYDNPRS